ncbi:hypothetical protein CHS0354_004230 [Potamilus streckersoni]|uniref:Uncharacterized protein n=1 Tax=Potamilus streckersoni TaxID=2493646 RepID=A0AAE0RS42_9BIVA|nr:hypothetical protein CHS0354_004230 [Potamilus streckersoni]
MKPTEDLRHAIKQTTTESVEDGFPKSKMLRCVITSSFPDVKVVVPHEAGMIVLKEAVVFGHSAFSIAQRVSKYTYGVVASRKFHDKIHDEDGPY